MSKRSSIKTKKRNVLGLLKDSCDDNVKRTEVENQTECKTPNDGHPDIDKCRKKVTFQSYTTQLEPEDEIVSSDNFQVTDSLASDNFQVTDSLASDNFQVTDSLASDDPDGASSAPRQMMSVRPCLEPVDEDDSSDNFDDPDPLVSDDPNDTDYWSSKQRRLHLGENKKKQQCLRWNELKKIAYNLECEWKDCDFTSFNSDDFITHVGSHIPSLEIHETEDGQDADAFYVCSWKECEMEMTTEDEAMRHVFYHGFHTKLKSIGHRMMNDKNHPKCLLNNERRNLVTNLTYSFSCCWDKCNFTVFNAQKFYYHVHAHAVCYVASLTEKNIHSTIVSCLWRGCRTKSKGQQKLRMHLMSHTKEKVAACPVCGTTFASKTKFFDHCSRQQPKHTNGFQCSHCARSYPHERLLRDHMRHHINSYKCPFCDMTSPTPTSLSLHIRNRHIADKPFKCKYCSYRAKSQHSITTHVKTHFSQAMYRCDEDDCTFSCRTVATLNRHIRRCHSGESETYFCCHICDARYLWGNNLSKHLIKKHNFRNPSGHSRFRYKCYGDGHYRLETVRYESLEVTQEMIQEGQQPAQQGTMLYLSEAEIAAIRPSVESSQMTNTPPLFIAYDTLDEQGNLISRLVGQPIVLPVVSVQPANPSVVLVKRNPSNAEIADQNESFQ